MAENKMEIAPLKSMDDFICNSARFQIPNFKDPDKWTNRVIHNLLYYQTNYFLLAIIIFLVVGVLHPLQFCCGMLAICVMFVIFYHITNRKAMATRFKRDHPLLSLLLFLAGGSFIVYMLGSVMVFLFGICLPTLVMLVHASMRLRNIKNKLTNKMDALVLKRTPMGFFLEQLGVESDKLVL
ncbi:PRA1 family protein 3-like [Pollicipes pollicipes]|uniref:PRA1 family protein 3-like n=1 Tax=Pollicipes pollicipes TaxID=41117 RepID=UPI001884F7F9|nr:PRA1 family protein 3-like [Pollicipes pollicipes]XP_037077660.1 PRA1 family protein 3-like [Pollicipes pollicipes]XP_037077661.1 PRA1 family protein 3-like [Pollicipes pollicipes]XP_037077662.1 PRA1 family protein 3-like [Pollicipes pollicipes]XP_037077663.1 PRA1 family protein 3-like [Pollicipes pollicipes]XP_037077664.1 PRA1 family protein 3-like [Pollicipes pollicipes]